MDASVASALENAFRRTCALQDAISRAIEEVEENATACRRRLEDLLESSAGEDPEDPASLRNLIDQVESARRRKIVALEGEAVAADAALAGLENARDDASSSKSPDSEDEAREAIKVALALPSNSVEPSTIELVWRRPRAVGCERTAGAVDALRRRLCAHSRLKVHDIVMRPLPKCILGHERDTIELTFSVGEEAMEGPEEAAVVLRSFERHLRVDAEIVFPDALSIRPLHLTGVRLLGSELVVEISPREVHFPLASSRLVLRRVSFAGDAIQFDEASTSHIGSFHDARDLGPAWRASKVGSVPALLEALRDGASTGEKNYSGATCMHVAARHGHDDVVAFLLCIGASGTGEAQEPGHRVQHHYFASPLLISVMQEHTSVMRRLLAHHSVYINARCACENVSTLKQGCEEMQQRSPSYYFGDVPYCIRAVIKNFSPLQAAICICKPEAVKVLLDEPSVDVSILTSSQQTLLHLATLTFIKMDSWRTSSSAKTATFKMIASLAAQGRIDPNARDAEGLTPLHLAVRKLNHETAAQAVKVLLDEPSVDVSILTSSQQTLLHLATITFIMTDSWRTSSSAKTATFKMIASLAAQGRIDPNARDAEGLTPLHIAVRNYYRETDALYAIHTLGAIADASVRDRRGNTPLHVAACRSSAAHANLIVEALVALPSADVNARNANGDTPLHIALKSIDGDSWWKSHQCSENSVSLRRTGPISPPPLVASLLKARGVDIAAKDAKGTSAFELMIGLGMRVPNVPGVRAEKLRLKLAARRAALETRSVLHISHGATQLLARSDTQMPQGAQNECAAKLRLKLAARQAAHGVESGATAAPQAVTAPRAPAEVSSICSAQRCSYAATLRCSRCKVAVYCSSACQATHWRSGHKTACRMLCA